MEKPQVIVKCSNCNEYFNPTQLSEEILYKYSPTEKVNQLLQLVDPVDEYLAKNIPHYKRSAEIIGKSKVELTRPELRKVGRNIMLLKPPGKELTEADISYLFVIKTDAGKDVQKLIAYSDSPNPNTRKLGEFYKIRVLEEPRGESTFEKLRAELLSK